MNIKKTIMYSVVLLLAASYLFAGQVKPLKEVVNPATITVSEKSVFITEGANVFIYSRENFKLTKKFGKLGEGPREFKVNPNQNNGSVSVILTPGNLLHINSVGRISLFSADGEFKKETKCPPFGGGYVPIGDGFAGVGYGRDGDINYFELTLYDASLAKKSTLKKRKMSFQRGKKINPLTARKVPIVRATADKLFLDGENGEIFVFDKAGKAQATITPAYETVKFTSSCQKKFEDFFSKDPRYREVFQQDRDKIGFPEAYPKLRNYFVAGGKVYVVTHKNVKGGAECLVFDLEGKLLKKSMLPLKELNALELYPHTVYDGKLFQLVENEEQESWELHITEIK